MLTIPVSLKVRAAVDEVDPKTSFAFSDRCIENRASGFTVNGDHYHNVPEVADLTFDAIFPSRNILVELLNISPY